VKVSVLRAPGLFYLVYALAGLVVTHWDRLFPAVTPSYSSGPAFDEIPPGHYMTISAVMTPLVVGLVPATAALAGIGLSPGLGRPSAIRIVQMAFLSMIPLALADWLMWPWGVVPRVEQGSALAEVALYLVLAAWIVSPVVLVRRLYSRANSV
jgi:hypothetical protein